MSRGKGNAAEREVAALLAKWWAPVEPEAKWCRTPLSGGWGGPQIRSGFFASGDLMTTAKRWPFVVEVKRREGWAWSTLLNGRPCPVWGWWRQSLKAAAEMNGIAILFFRRNREPWHVMLPKEIRATGGMLFRVVSSDCESLDLSRVDVGGVTPVLITAEEFFEFDPFRLARARSDS